jgi:hypothetical protein
MLALAHADDFPFNDTFIAQLRKASEDCGYNDYIAKALTFPPDGHFKDPIGINEKTGEPTKDCEIFGSIFSEIFWINPCWVSFQFQPQMRDTLTTGVPLFRISIKWAKYVAYQPGVDAYS